MLKFGLIIKTNLKVILLGLGSQVSGSGAGLTRLRFRSSAHFMVEGPSREHKQLILTSNMYLQYHDCIGSSIRIIIFS